MRVVYCALALSVGCSFSPGMLRAGDDAPDDAAPDDAASDDGTTGDMMLDASLCSLWSPAPKHFMPCALPEATGGLVLTMAGSPYKIDTTSGVLNNAGGPIPIVSTTVTQTGGPDAFVLVVSSLTVEAQATLVVNGDKPLIIASFDTISISGTIDATSRNGGSAGAGSLSAASCGAAAGNVGANEADNGGGSGGGGGGAFRGAGGRGGPGDGGQNAGGAGGTAVGAFPTFVRGGCPGERSGSAGPDSQVGNNDNVTTPGGAGGGAVQLSARTSIVFAGNGRVLAGGAGGSGCILATANGGGGGGSGGYIGFDAPIVTLVSSTVIAANGGAGGSSDQFVAVGDPGQDGQASASAALGGPGSPGGSPCAPPGANGAAGATLTGPDATQNAFSCGGGGGGGGVGFIGVFSAGFTAGGATVSPSAQTNPF